MVDQAKLNFEMAYMTLSEKSISAQCTTLLLKSDLLFFIFIIFEPCNTIINILYLIAKNNEESGYALLGSGHTWLCETMSFAHASGSSVIFAPTSAWAHIYLIVQNSFTLNAPMLQWSRESYLSIPFIKVNANNTQMYKKYRQTDNMQWFHWNGYWLFHVILKQQVSFRYSPISYTPDCLRDETSGINTVFVDFYEMKHWVYHTRHKKHCKHQIHHKNKNKSHFF